MKNFVIGDLQGCAHEAQVLLNRIAAESPDGYHVVFVGDLVNRGPASLQALRRSRTMQQAGLCEALLGNHDLHLLAVYAGTQTRSKSDTLDEILDAPDCDELMAWLRCRPLAVQRAGCLMVHAGVLPQWSAAQTLALAGEVQHILRGPDWKSFLSEMYGNDPDKWDDSLAGSARLRCIVNALTRMRLCERDGTMDFHIKESAGAPEGSSLLPWFDLPERHTADITVVFGHWSALGLVQRPNLIGLDSGCVWGGKLTAVCLEDRSVLQVDCPEYKPHTGKK